MDQLSIQDLLAIAERHKKNQASVLKAVHKYNDKKRLEKIKALGFSSVEEWREKRTSHSNAGRPRKVLTEEEVAMKESKKAVKVALRIESKKGINGTNGVDLTSVLSAMTLKDREKALEKLLKMMGS